MTLEQPLLTRTLLLWFVGKDVDASKRTVYIGLDELLGGQRLKAHTQKKKGETPTMALARRRTLGPFFLSDYNKLRALMGYKKSSRVGPEFITACAKKGFTDAYAISLFNAYADEHKPPPKPKIPDLGPVMAGGQSVLDHDCTHETAGIPLYPAFDDAFWQGRSVIAPEPMRVTESSHSNPGQAFYATGDSHLRYWFAHLDRTHQAGTRFRKGEVVGRVGPNHVGGGPHCHVGVNVEYLWGPGTQLAHRSDYRHGAPTIRSQLASHR